MKTSIIQKALGVQWQHLPEALKKHYLENDKGENRAQGHLTIDFPWFMKIPLSILRFFGALINKRGNNLPTNVYRVVSNGEQRWQRRIDFPNNKPVIFNSVVYHNKNNEIIEFINSVLGMKMKVHVENNTLRYESNGYVIKLGKLRIPYPEFLALGHGRIIEKPVDDNDENSFEMDFRLKHPIFGEVFSYKGIFQTIES